MDSSLKSQGFKTSHADSCLYVKLIEQENKKVDFVIIALYVDDILLFSNNDALLNQEKQTLSEKFAIVDQGDIHYILGMSVKRGRANIIISVIQPKHLSHTLKFIKF